MAEQLLLRRPLALRVWIAGALALFCLLAVAPPALAHRMIVFAYAEGDTIHTESTFVPDTPVRRAQLEVLEPQSGRVLVTGITDDRGKFYFKIPPEAAAARLDLKIVVDGGLGHRGEWLLKADNYLPDAKPEQAPAPAATPAPASSGTGAAGLDRQLLEEALNAALERQLAPVREQLAQTAVRRTSLPDIIGGIGYIIGLFGLWAYFLSRRKQNP